MNLNPRGANFKNYTNGNATFQNTRFSKNSKNPKTPKTPKIKKVAGVPGKYPEYPEYPRYLLDMCPGGPGNLRDLVGKMWEEEPLKFAWAGVQTTRNERHDHGCTLSVFYVP